MFRLSLLFSTVVVAVLIFVVTVEMVTAVTPGVSCGTGTYSGEYCGTPSGVGRCDGGNNCAIFTTFCSDGVPCAYGSPDGLATSVDVTQSGNGATNAVANCVLNQNVVQDPYTCAYATCVGMYNGALCVYPVTGTVPRQVGTCSGSGTCALGVTNALKTAIINSCSTYGAAAVGQYCAYGTNGEYNALATCNTAHTCGFTTCGASGTWNGAICTAAGNLPGVCAGSVCNTT